MYNFLVNLYDDEQIETLKQRFARQARDHDDLQHEIAGRDVGRLGRFLPEGAQSAGSNSKARQERAEALTRLQMALLNDPAYAAAYRETERALNDAQGRLDTLLERVRREIEASGAALEEKRSRAARLDDGTRVYRDKDGIVRAENGDSIADDVAAGVIWSGDEPSYESMQRGREDRDRLHDIETDIIHGQSRIGDIQAELADEDELESEETMEIFRREAEDIVRDVEERLEVEAARQKAAPDEPTTEFSKTAEIIVPSF